MTYRSRGRPTERTFYPALMDVIGERDGSSVSEVRFNSEPDITFELSGKQWIMPVKIYETQRIYLDLFKQYLRHRRELGGEYGLLLCLSKDVRKIKPSEEAINKAVREEPCLCIIDTPLLGKEISAPFPQVLDIVIKEIIPKIDRGEKESYPLDLVISSLKQHTQDLMGGIDMMEKKTLEVMYSKDLLFEIGKKEFTFHEIEKISRFLASCIFLSQILFLRLFSRVRPSILPDEKPVSRLWLKKAFKKVWDINYRPIYRIDVLDLIHEDYIRDTFDLIWNLKVEYHRHELPGRIFHELMPDEIRKMLAAFYTRPQAADCLAHLVIKDSDDTVFDPACGSGTILTSAYRRKRELFNQEGKSGNPHVRFCEKEIFGSDIMPFAVHLTTANLASLDPNETIKKTQLIQGDSLELSEGYRGPAGIQLELLPKRREGQELTGEKYEVNLNKTRVVLMNPPFTKVERGIKKYIDAKRFEGLIGGEVGLWGHFIGLADEFIENNGRIGAILPINLLRGRESAKVRNFLFSKWKPLYIIKPTLNYGFTEGTTYRDCIFVACKEKPSESHKVRFALIKKDLSSLDEDDIYYITHRIQSFDRWRDEDLEIENFSIRELRKRFSNMMWFCGVSSFDHRDKLISFIKKTSRFLHSFPDNYFCGGYRPYPRGVSSFLFLTRSLEPSRIKKAFLHFDDDSEQKVIKAISPRGVPYKIEKKHLTPSLRTGVGMRTLNIQDKLDYIAKCPYRALRKVLTAINFYEPEDFKWEVFWQNLERELNKLRTNIIVQHRIGPYSPNTCLISFTSDVAFSPSDVLHVVNEPDLNRSKALCVILNSALFLAHFFLLKEETTATWINIRHSDLMEMPLYPDNNVVPALAKVFDNFSKCEFPSLRDQLDRGFDKHYKAFQESRRTGQQTFSDTKCPISPSQIRLEFDLSVCKAIGASCTAEDLYEVYEVIIKEMIVTCGLKRD